MIIDFHTHIFSDEVRSDRNGFLDDPGFNLLYADENARIIGHNDLIEAMDNGRVDRAVAMGFQWQKENSARIQNEYFAKVQEETSGRILCFGTIATNSENIPGEAREIKKNGLYGIGEISWYNNGLNDENEKKLRAILTAAAEESLPVCLHVNEPIGHSYPGKYPPSFERLYNIICDFREVKIVLAHWGGGLLFYELMPEVKEAFSNVMYDTAASPYLFSDSIYTAALALVNPGKILFGSDYPLLDFSRYIVHMRNKCIDKTALDMMLGGNAMNLLGISE